MVKFDEYQYSRPDIEEVKVEFEAFLQEFNSASSYEQQNEVIEKINTIGSDYSTMASLAYIRSSIDTNDEFYQTERDYFDEIDPNTRNFKQLTTENLSSLHLEHNSKTNGVLSYLL